MTNGKAGYFLSGWSPLGPSPARKLGSLACEVEWLGAQAFKRLEGQVNKFFVSSLSWDVPKPNHHHRP